ncbi:uncharacterized protein [Typha latifolia]|uniref:uncharacterized protein n=1 Tax=Typha latifolia TaxID=4733 RepID=UPI003C2C0BEA
MVNRGIEQYLRCFVGETLRRWLDYLLWAEWSYNTAFHSTIGMTPFEAVYGRPPPTLRTYDPEASVVRMEKEMELADRDVVLWRLREHMTTNMNRMNQVYDRWHRELEFEVGVLVFVRAQPYRQVTLRPVRNPKLAHQYFGPFRELE